MIKLGLDFYDTITKAPKTYKRLAETVLAGGGEVHIVSAVAPEHVQQVQKDIRRSHVPYTSVHILTFTHYLQVVDLKAMKAQELGLDVYIDDRKDVCDCVGKKTVALKA